MTVEQRLQRIETRLNDLRHDHTRYIDTLLKMTEGLVEWLKANWKEE